MKNNIALSFIVYGLGLLSFLIADIFVSNTFSIEDISKWAFFKSVIFIIGSISIFGYDQVLVRDNRLIKKLFKPFVIQSLMICVSLITIISFLKKLDIYEYFFLIISTLFFAYLNYFSSATRSNYLLVKSQFFVNGWKVILLILLLIFYFENVLIYFFISIGSIFFLSLFLIRLNYDYPPATNHIISKKESKKLAFAFLLSNLTLIFSIYGEQFIINLLNKQVTSAYLFRYFAVFTPIALSLNGFLGFYLGPKIRRLIFFSKPQYFRLTLNIVFVSLLFCLISLFIGYLYFTFYLTEGNNLDWIIIVLLTLMCFVRGIYVSTSVCLGIFASDKYLSKVAYLFWATSIIYILSLCIILFFIDGIIAARYIAFATLINWTLRLIISNNYTLKTIN